MKSYRPTGWKGEPYRHYLAAKGVKTGVKKNVPSMFHDLMFRESSIKHGKQVKVTDEMMAEESEREMDEAMKDLSGSYKKLRSEWLQKSGSDDVEDSWGWEKAEWEKDMKEHMKSKGISEVAAEKMLREAEVRSRLDSSSSGRKGYLVAKKREIEKNGDEAKYPYAKYNLDYDTIEDFYEDIPKGLKPGDVLAKGVVLMRTKDAKDKLTRVRMLDRARSLRGEESPQFRYEPVRGVSK